MSNEETTTTPEQVNHPQETAATDTARAPRRPDYVVYNVLDTDDGKGQWVPIGGGWKHRDDKGIQVQLRDIPNDGRITLRERRDERMQSYAEQRTAQIQPTQLPTQSHGYEQ